MSSFFADMKMSISFEYFKQRPIVNSIIILIRQAIKICFNLINRRRMYSQIISAMQIQIIANDKLTFFTISSGFFCYTFKYIVCYLLSIHATLMSSWAEIFVAKKIIAQIDLSWEFDSNVLKVISFTKTPANLIYILRIKTRLLSR